MEIRELLKREMFSRPGQARSCDLHFEKSRPCPYGMYGVSDQYVLLDSAEKNGLSQTNCGKYCFNFAVQSGTRDQSIGCYDTIDNVIEIQLMPFYTPTPLASAHTTSLTLVPNPGPVALSPLPYRGRIALYLTELGAQAVSITNGRRIHFELESETTTDGLYVRPVAGHECYFFTNPIKDIHGLTLCFYDPYEPLSFPEDVVNVLPSTNGPTFELIPNLGETHNLQPGDRIYVSGMSTASSAINDYVNRRDGLVVGDGTTPSSIKLNPDIDTSSFSGLTSGPVKIVVAKNRIRILMRMRRVVDRLTNYRAP